ncbi:MAG: coiled-coil domain-containing protein [Isosphaeraceae bacterium]
MRQAEAKTRARKLEGETQHAAEQFRAAELRARRAVERLRVLRPAALRTLEQADHDEQMLKELVRKLALYKSSLSSETDAEHLVAASREEIERTRREARQELEDVTREVEDARRELRVATDQYRSVRREIDRLQPELAEPFAAEDRLLWDAEAHFPGGQLQLLAHEVDAGLNAFGSLGKLEQYARLKVWIGRFRHYQASHDRDADMTEELQALSHRVFHQLKFLSRQYEPGYIEAFRQDFTTDWAAYVAEAQEQLIQAIENGRRHRDAESQAARDREPVGGAAAAVGPRPAAGFAAGVSAARGAPSSLAELRSLVVQARLPEDGLDEFLGLLRQAVEDVGVSNTELLRLALPFREHISGGDGLDLLRRALDRIQARRDETPARDEVETDDEE